MQKDNVILTGMMGSGKTSVGKALSKILECDFYDLDEIIEEKHGSISKIFKEKGENYFRQIEQEEIENFLGKNNFVLSLGGGAVLREKNLEILKKIGRIFYLSAQSDTIYERIKGQNNRPLLNVENPKEEIEKILSQRLQKYKKAGEEVKTDKKEINEIAREIYERINCQP